MVRNFLWLGSGVAALDAVYLGAAWRWLGFPDGHLTELARFQTYSFPCFVVALLLLAIASLIVGRTQELRERFGRSCLVLIVMVLVASFGVDAVAYA